MNQDIEPKIGVAILLLVGLGLGFYVGHTINPEFFKLPSFSKVLPKEQTGKIVKFASKEEFVKYLSSSQLERSFGFGGGLAVPTGLADIDSLAEKGGGGAGRVSETNVQVKGIDEPDIVKTDGKNIFYSQLRAFFEIEMKRELLPPDGRFLPETSEVKILSAFPPEELGELSKIAADGDLLLSGDVLIVFSRMNGNNLSAYDVSKPASPKFLWEKSLESGSYIVTSRLHEGKIYLVISTYVNFSDPCPITILKSAGEGVTVPCEEIYHPATVVPTDSTFTAMLIDPKTGSVEKTASFVGASYTSVVYMSPEALYLTYPVSGDMFAYLLDFFKTSARDLVPREFTARLEKIKTYEISDASKFNELMYLWQGVISAKTQEEEQKRFQETLEARLQDYTKAHLRELGQTSIVKIRLDDFAIAATGQVPGSLINQFAIDEHENHLRVAVTVGEGVWALGLSRPAQTENDIYVLDENLKIKGELKGLGLSERIYSARFAGNKGYLVTFRQIDPFYVLDLRDPQNPKLSGELKIPGFSSYLDPIAEGRVVGIGQEEGKVKISLFDVSNPAAPAEADKYFLDEGWSEASSNHHAFLADQLHQVFFLPAGAGGYVFSYAGDKLSPVKIMSGASVERALYLNDYLYILGPQKITVLDENTWETIKELDI